MSPALNELKIRARVRLNAIRRADPGVVADSERLAERHRLQPPPEWKLHHTLNLSAMTCGFSDWEHARRVLGGTARTGDDMGALWHAPDCLGMLNHWFVRYPEARDFLDRTPRHYLLPYRRQFLVVDESYLEALALDASNDRWAMADRDLVASYGGAAWAGLCHERVRAIPSNSGGTKAVAEP